MRLMDALAEELPVLRASLRISQDELSKRIGVSRQTYSAIETLKQPMTWITFMALIAFFENNPKTAKLLDSLGFYENEDFIACIQYLK